MPAGFAAFTLSVITAIGLFPASALASSAAGTLAFSAASYSVNESAGTLTITAYRSGGSTGTVSAYYSTKQGSALYGEQYSPKNGRLVWDSGDTASKTFSIPIIKTSAFSGTKTLSVELSDVNGGASLGLSTAAVNIIGSSASTTSSGSGTLSFSASSYSVKQTAGSLTVTAVRTGGTTGEVSAYFTTLEGTALYGQEYSPKNGRLTWKSGDSSAKSFSIPIIQSAVFTGTKALSVVMSDLVGGAKLGSPSSAAVTISSTSVASAVALSSATYSVSQAAGALTVTAVRTGGSSGAASIAYATASNTAVAGTNFTAMSGVLTWASGDMASKSFSVHVSDAAPFSGTKNFSVSLSSPGGAASLGSTKSAVVTIDGAAVAASVIDLGASSYSVSQSGKSLTVTVKRSGSASAAASVGYATANNTAVAGTDYTASSGKLTWAAGDGTAKTFSVAISNASPFTGTKSFAVAIAAPSGASLGTPSNASVTISGDLSVAVSGAMGQAAAARLLNQGTFGATLDTVKAASTQTYAQWFAAQAAVTPSLMTPLVTSNAVDWTPIWMDHVVLSQDQLRQRMAFALSEILVVSSVGVIGGHNQALVNYYDILVNNSLGNFRTLLQQVTLSPAMGKFLSMWQNAAANPALNTHADQNYAREVMQLFTVGLVKLNIDGTVQTDGSGNPLSTYSQTDVANLANVFTGWGSAPVSQTGDQAWEYDDDETDPMVAYQDFHDVTQKTIIGGVVVAAGGTAAADLKIALDTLFNHPNVGPFLSKQLIQRLVTSNPSPAYVQRVAQVFNNNGSGVRGDLLAVASAILSDSEAANAGGSTYGKLREPLLRLTQLWRAFSAVNATGHTNEYSVGEYLDTNSDEYQLESPSVFNFFQPSFQLAGALTTANLVVPEFQILNENTLVRTGNELQVQTYQFIDGAGVSHAGADVDLSQYLNSTSVMLHTAEWESLAATPAALVDQMNVVLMSGQMSTAMRTALIAYATAVPASSPGSRVAETAELLINSPQYAVQR